MRTFEHLPCLSNFAKQTEKVYSTLRVPDNVDACSHLKAVEYYTASISNQFLAYEGELQGLQAVRTGTSSVVVGYNLVPSSVQSSRVYIVEEILPINQGKLLYKDGTRSYRTKNLVHKKPQPTKLVSLLAPLEIVDLPMVANNWPPIQLVEVISGVTLHIHQVQEGEPQITSVFFNRRHPQQMGLLGKLLNLGEQTPTYLIVDGEYLNENDWYLKLFVGDWG